LFCLYKKKNMKQHIEGMDYGIYIDHPHAIVIAFQGGNESHQVYHSGIGGKHQIHFRGEGSDKTGLFGHTLSNESKHQHQINGDFKKFCKMVIETLAQPRRIFVFGPSDAKFELQRDIRDTKSLQAVPEELKTSTPMEAPEAIRFARDHFAHALPVEVNF